MGINVEALWFNPNIHPYKEYEARLGSVKRLEDLWRLKIYIDDHYGLIDFLRNTVFRERYRCHYCYNIRLEATAKKAKDLGKDAYTTSLLVSPYQDREMIIEIGRMMAARYDVEFYEEDFRVGFYEGRRQGREMGFYQQRYCGCIYSEMERYGGQAFPSACNVSVK
jgi:predicted adenine nucleotide alpha hydrolase (AANH) superfamily ATPase